ncbi:MAG TPA: glycosyltransferase [Pyrinomonadaceae bacterium]|jgi:glycosyltransferase involved in cell wall biosynthesis|nr:glycosyltransferase [Pyrinomonadaceae bacterium]
MPSVSVVITTYNRAQLLRRAIESALNAGSDPEVIIVDDCSTDDTREVCEEFAGIRYVRLRSNRGLAHARNVGIAESSCEFIAFLDDDDLRLPGSLDTQFRVLSADHNTAFCYGQALMGDARRQLPTGEIYPISCPQGDIFWDLLEDNFIPMPSVLARKSSLINLGGFNTDLSLIEDWDMWLRLSEHFLIAAIEEPVAIYRKPVAESNQMCSNSAQLCRQALYVQQMALNRPRAQVAPRSRRRYVRRRFRDRAYEILMTEATNSIHEGDAKSARANLLDAFRFRPFRTVVSGRLPWLLIATR